MWRQPHVPNVDFPDMDDVRRAAVWISAFSSRHNVGLGDFTDVSAVGLSRLGGYAMGTDVGTKKARFRLGKRDGKHD